MDVWITSKFAAEHADPIILDLRNMSVNIQMEKVMHSPHIILLAHGSRDPRWCQTLEEGLEVITAQLKQDSSLAYLEKADPCLEKAITAQYDAGVRKFIVVPLFFAAGKHLLHDVPELTEQIEHKYPDIDITVQEALGNNKEFWQFLGVFLTREINNYHYG